jgi:DNA-binding transcriptional LysR family regulator
MIEGCAVLTLRQAEALVWIARTGSFEGAARTLNTTQSAISKRIHDLEALSATPLFERVSRGARLTPHGRLVLSAAEGLLQQRDQMAGLLRPSPEPRGRFRLGVTEMTALTWLPALVSSLRQAYPQVDLEPEVESSETLYDRLRQDRVDLIVVPDAFPGARFPSRRVGEAELAWMCSPDLPLPDEPLALSDLQGLTVLVQDSRSGSGMFYRRWLAEQGVRLSYRVSSNSLLALIGMTASGLGLSYLPIHACQPLLRAGRLRMIAVDPPLPPVPYVAMFAGAASSPYEAFVAEQAQAVCDFSRPLYPDAAALGA